MLRVNPLEFLVMRQIRETRQALSKEEKAEYDRKIAKDRTEREQKARNEVNKAFANNARDKRMQELPTHVKRELNLPHRVLVMKDDKPKMQKLRR